MYQFISEFSCIYCNNECGIYEYIIIEALEIISYIELYLLTINSIVIDIFILLLLISFIPTTNLDEAYTYSHMALMSLRSHYSYKAYMVLTRSDH